MKFSIAVQIYGQFEAGTYSERTLEGDVVAAHTGNGIVGNGSLSILQDRGDINGFPLDGGL